MAKTKKVYDIIPPGKGGDRLINLKSKGTKAKKRVRGRSKLKKPLYKNWVFLLIGVLIIIALFLYFYLPKTEITIWPKTNILTFEKDIILDASLKEVDMDLSSTEEIVISAGIFEASREEEKEFPATGEFAQEGKAKGVIRVYNNFHQTQILVKNTRFQPPLEKVMYFRTTKRIVIPSKSYVDVEVVADQVGPDYNIEASTFSVPGLAGLAQYYSVYGKSFSAMEGGFIGKVATVTEEDIEDAKKVLAEELLLLIKDYLKERVPSGFVLLEETFQEQDLETSSEAEIGDKVDQFVVNAKAIVKVMLYKQAYLEDLANNYFLSEKNPNKEIQKNSLKIEHILDEINWEENKAKLRLKASVKIYSPLDTEDLRQRLVGKSLKDSREFLMSWADIERVDIKFWPFWLRKVPGNVKTISIEIILD